MKKKKLTLGKIRNFRRAIRLIGFSIIIMLFLTSISFASDKSDNIKYSNSNQSFAIDSNQSLATNSNQSLVNKNNIKENYHPDVQSSEIFYTKLPDMDPQEIAKNIEAILINIKSILIIHQKIFLKKIIIGLMKI